MKPTLKLILGLNYVGATYQEGCRFIQRYERERGLQLVNWAQTDDMLLAAMTTPEHDGWQGVVLVDGDVIDYDGTRWFQNRAIA